MVIDQIGVIIALAFTATKSIWMCTYHKIKPTNFNKQVGDDDYDDDDGGGGDDGYGMW